MTSETLRDSRQEFPYPAYRWLWRTQHSWPWQSQQHINILEVHAYFMHLRHRARSTRKHHNRFVHILDSTVATGVIAKGRSSSRRLNRVSRRAMALVIATDMYPLVMWTISSWNFSDHGSRQHDVGPDAATYQ